MDTIAIPVQQERLVTEVTRIDYESIADGAGSAHGTNGTEGWIYGLSIARLFGPGYEDALIRFPAISETLIWLCNAREKMLVQCMVSRLVAGGELRPHMDGEPANERWHLPVITNGDAVWWDAQNGSLHMEPRKWWGPVPYCGVYHGFKNGDTERIHVIADLGS